MSDDIDKEVAALLPCSKYCCEPIQDDDDHVKLCPWRYRHAVAAWARKREHKAQVLEGSAQRLHISNLETELADLRQQLAAAQAEAKAARDEIEAWRKGVRQIITALGGSQPELISFNAVCDAAERALMAAHVAGMREAADIAKWHVCWNEEQFGKCHCKFSIEGGIAAAIAEREGKAKEGEPE